MAVVGVHYDEFKSKNLNYKGVYISYNGGKKEFNTGNFIKDWYDCNAFIINDLGEKEPYISNSSTVDHFIMDGAPYESAYLKTLDNGETWDFYYGSEHYQNGIEFFVNTGDRPTWEQFKNKYKSS